MAVSKKSIAFEKIAPQSPLILLISRLYRLSSVCEADRFQRKINQLKLRHSVLSLSGRLELIQDLILEQQGHLEEKERAALQALCDGLTLDHDESQPFLDFSAEGLRLTIRRLATVLPPGPLPPGGRPARTLLVALSLSGLIAAGCTQENSPWPESRRAEAPAVAQSPATADARAAADEGGGALKTYTVCKGDSLSEIAARGGLDPEAIARLNRVRYDSHRDWYVLYPGQVLQLPEKRESGVAAARPAAADTADGFYLKGTEPSQNETVHVVQKGESLWKIAAAYRVPLAQVIKANGILNPRRIKYGSMLKIPVTAPDQGLRQLRFHRMSREKKVEFLKQRTIRAGHPYLDMIVSSSEEYRIDPRLYASLIWEESWFDARAQSKDNCRKLAQLDPRFHSVSEDPQKNFRKSLGYLKHEIDYYRSKGFDRRSATISALAAYNGGNTRIRRYIREGRWDGKSIETIPLRETREHLKKVVRRCEQNYHAVL